VTNRATGLGSMPGTDFAEATRVVLGEVGELPHLVELPDRGPGGSMTGRAVALVAELAFDLQPAGWRLTGSPGVDARRAHALLAQDLDVAEEMVNRPDTYKIQVVGPWTLASTVERPRGDKALSDSGARRDLAQALAQGVSEHCADVRRRLEPGKLIIQIDEPALPAVLAGAVPTASGFSRHRSITPADAAQALTWVAEVVLEAGATPVMHCCAPNLPFDVLRSTPVSAVSFDLGLLDAQQYDDIGGWLDLGRQVWLGVVPTMEPAGPPPSDSDLTNRVLTWWRDLGFTDLDALPETTLTPTCGLAGATPAWAREALALCQRATRNLSVEQGRMDP
jgi:methionine synthase II (cobalamin-independent)